MLMYKELKKQKSESKLQIGLLLDKGGFRNIQYFDLLIKVI